MINKIDKVGLKYFGDPNTFIKYSNNLNNIHKNIDKSNIDKHKNVSHDIITEKNF